MPPPLRFGIFELDRAAGELRRQGLKIRLPDQALQVLLALLDHPGNIVTREGLYQRLWPAGSQVDFDRGLNKAVNRVREALGDDADNPRFIETLPQRGYRFIGPVQTEELLVTGLAQPASAEVPRRWWLGAGALAATLPLAVGVRSWSGWRTSAPIESLAVLPLENLSGDPEQEYFSEGLTDVLIGEIARLGALRVTSRTSSMRYRKSSDRKALPEIAAELGVDAIVEGTVQQSGGRVRISVQLIRARDDRHLWAGKYERELTDMLALQAEVGESIVRELQAEMGANVVRRLPRGRVRPESYDAFLRGDYFLHRGIGALTKSLDAFQQAIDQAPDFADAHAGLGECLCYMGIFGMRPSAEALPMARRAALKALEIDPSHPAAHNVQAEVLKGFNWDLNAAEAEYRRARALNGSHLLTRLWYAECLARLLRFDEALDEANQAVALDPVSPLSHNNRAMLFWRARRPREAVQAAHNCLELDASFVNAYWWLGMAYADLHDFGRAIEALSKGNALGNGPIFRGLLAHVYARCGRRERVPLLLKELETIAKSRYVSPVDFAIVYAGLGDADTTFRYLEEAFRTRATRVHELSHPYFDSFAHDSRYKDLLNRTGLPA